MEENQNGDQAAAAPPAAAPVLNSNVPLPPKFNTDGDVASEWRRWKQVWNSYEIVTGLHTQPAAYRTATFITCIGPDALEIFNGLPFTTDEEKNDIETVLELFEKHCVGETNVIYERYVFNNRVQEAGETFDNFVSSLRTLSQSCNYGALRDDLIRDRIVCAVSDTHLRKQLLQEPKLTLKSAIAKGRASEATQKQLKAMGVTSEVNAVRHKESKRGTMRMLKRCKYCGESHVQDKKRCPAYGHKCCKCSKYNHYETLCLSSQHSEEKQSGSTSVRRKKHKHRSSRRVHQIYDTSDASSCESDYEYVDLITAEHVNAVENSSESRKVFAKMHIPGRGAIRFQVDSGATVNVINKAMVPRKSMIQPTATRLRMYNNSPMAVLGEARIPMTNAKNDRKYKVRCIVVSEDVQPIIGLTAAQHMELITINTENIAVVHKQQPSTPLTSQAIAEQFPALFDGKLGTLRENVDLTVDTEIQPIKNAPRRVPHAMMQPLKDELDRLEKLQVIEKVTEPTEWLSSLVTVKKPNGKLRLCIDPQPLNTALKRAPFMTPIIDDILPQLSGARVFSVIDVKDGYWHLKLSENASNLTAMNTPYGNYKWLRYPFGLKTSSDDFQESLHDKLRGLGGIHIIADDILVVGKGIDHNDATRDHDSHLLALLQRCQESGIKLNKEKMKLRCTEVPYMGHTLTSEGMKADSKKIDAIINMQPPTDTAGVRRLMGMVNYLTRFLPNVSSAMTPIRKLTNKDKDFKWAEEHQKAFEDIKKLITSSRVLKYFDPKSTNITLHCDSSRTGLGTCLIQDDQPIGFGSRSLTNAEQNYAQIELELLSVIYGLEHFHQITYGRKITVYTDHKPLENISRKPVIDTPRRLQRMLLRLHAYDALIVYKPGTSNEMSVPDALSRASLKSTHGPSSSHNTHVFYAELESINYVHGLNMSDRKIQQLQNETKNDATLQQVIKYISTGWPDRQSVTPDAMPYHAVRDSLSIQESIIFKDEKIVVPRSMRRDVLEQLHSPHLGINSTLRSARDTVYWPNYTTEIKDFLSKCDVCAAYSNKQQREPIIQHELPTRPYQFISADIFTFDSRDYLITTCHFSNFWEIDRLHHGTAKEVIAKLKKHIAFLGIPDSLVTDRGSVFTSQEFNKFAHQYGFKHVLTSAYHHNSNPSELAVKTAKNIMRKARDAGNDMYMAILQYRNTPSEDNLSPAQKLLSRRTKTALPTKPSRLEPRQINVDHVYTHKKALRDHQKLTYNLHAKALPSLGVGDTVRIEPTSVKKGQAWESGIVEQQVGERSYNVLTPSGIIKNRNRAQLRKTSSAPPTQKQPTENQPITAAHETPSVHEQHSTLEHHPHRTFAEHSSLQRECQGL